MSKNTTNKGNRGVKARDFEQLYRDFSAEIDKVPLPDEKELRAMLRKHDEKAIAAPLQPRRASLHAKTFPWRYAAAAVLLLGVVATVWLTTNRRQQSPVLAMRFVVPEEVLHHHANVTEVTISENMDQRIASLVEEPDVALAVVSDVTVHFAEAEADTLIPIPGTEVDTTLLAQIAEEVDAAAEETFMLREIPTAKSKVAMEDYPVRPTATEMDSVVKPSNSQGRAVKNKKGKKPKKGKKQYWNKDQNDKDINAVLFLPNKKKTEPEEDCDKKKKFSGQ